MPTTIKTCTKCILNDRIDGVTIGYDGICNLCNDYHPFIPYDEKELLKIFHKVKKKKRIYDALVPISGGKDSTYVLYLAVKKYNLNVLTYTFDNGFMNDLAKDNIARAAKKCKVDHIWVKHDPEFIHELYRTALVNSGELCGICGTGIERSMLKVSEAWKTPLILMGHSPTEANSFTSENIYDQARLKAIIKKNRNIDRKLLNRFLIYPKLNFITSYLYTKTGRFGKKVNILYYLDNLSDKEIGNILKKEMDWKESDQSEYTRHFDCLAEPFSNFIRDKRFGYSRRLPQLSNMIRNKEITREEAIKIFADDHKSSLPFNYEMVMSSLHLNENDLDGIAKIPINVFSDKKSRANMIFASVRKLIKK